MAPLSLYQIIEKTQDDVNQATLYNNASLAWNTDFFLQGLNPEPLTMTDKLIAVIEDNFGSVAKFKEEVHIQIMLS
jgi:superoxide dismutase